MIETEINKLIEDLKKYRDFIKPKKAFDGVDWENFETGMDLDWEEIDETIDLIISRQNGE